MDAIEEFVARWHQGLEGDTPLHEALGMGFAEYAAWVADAGALDRIVEARRAHDDGASPIFGVGG